MADRMELEELRRLDQLEAKAMAMGPKPSRGEALARGAYYGGWQQPRDVAAAGVAKLFGGIPFKEGLSQAREMSLEGRQGEVKEGRPGYFGTGQIAGNIATSWLPASAATKAVGAVAPALSSIPVAGKAIGNTAKAIGASKGIIGVPASGAIQGATMTGMTEGDLSGAIPGALGASAASIVGKLFRPIGDEAISSARKGYTNVLKGIGIDDLTPGQLTGNKNLELVDSVLNEMLPTAGAARKKTEGQLRKFTQAALEKAGINADEFTPAVREMAESEFNKRYTTLIADEAVKLDDPVIQKIAEISAKQVDKLPTNIKPVVQSYMKDILGAGDEMSGAAYQQARSQLSQQARSMATTDPFTANVLRSLRNTLDDAAERSLPEAKKGAWRELNRQYANYKVLQKAGSSVSGDTLEGLISPSALNRAVEAANKTKSQAGYGDLYGLGRAGRSVLADSVPNSGTAQRQLVQQLLTGGGVGGITYGVTQDPKIALGAAAGTLAGPKLAQVLMNSPAAQTYFTKGVPFLNQAVTPAQKQMAAMLAAGGK